MTKINLSAGVTLTLENEHVDCDKCETLTAKKQTRPFTLGDRVVYEDLCIPCFKTVLLEHQEPCDMCARKTMTDRLRPLEFADIGRMVRYEKLCTSCFWPTLNGLKAKRVAFIAEKAKADEATRRTLRSGSQRKNRRAAEDTRRTAELTALDFEAQEAVTQMRDEAEARRGASRRAKNAKRHEKRVAVRESFADIEQAMLKQAGEA